MSACTKYFNGLVLPRDRFETVGSKLNLPKCSSNATAQAIAYLKLMLRRKLSTKLESPRIKFITDTKKA